MSKIIPRKRNWKPVRKPYSWPKLKNDVLSVYVANDKKNGLRGLAKKYGVSHGVIQRILAGHEPKRADIRRALGLPALVSVSACPDCGEGHVKSRCPNKSKPAKPRRIWQRCAMDVWAIVWGQRP